MTLEDIYTRLIHLRDTIMQRDTVLDAYQLDCLDDIKRWQSKLVVMPQKDIIVMMKLANIYYKENRTSNDID